LCRPGLCDEVTLVALRFRILASGSGGNAALVEAGGTRLLVDAGLGPRILSDRLSSAGVDPASLAAVVLTHEHNDHIRGAARFCARWGVPLAGTRGTYLASGLGAETIPGYQVLEPGAPRHLGSLEVSGVPVPHDAAAPLAYVISWDGWSLGLATDLGHVSQPLAEAFRGCDALILESNYDPAMLRDGPYPWPLKERILARTGHLSNSETSRFLGQELGESCRTVVLAHLSQNNNHPEVARMAAEEALRTGGRTEVGLLIAGPRGTDWIEVGPPSEAPEASDQLRLW
jgi:phosphoribosyl 1,2-cyclic phosphodiesterase